LFEDDKAINFAPF